MDRLPRRRFSHPLLPGMTVGLIAPASPIFEPERRDAAVRLLEGMGFRVRRGATVDAADAPTPKPRPRISTISSTRLTAAETTATTSRPLASSPTSAERTAGSS